MKNITKNIILILIIIAVLYFIRINYSTYNANKSISACVLAQKKLIKDFNKENAEKYCKENLSKNK